MTDDRPTHLTDPEVRTLTGKVRYSAQQRALARMGFRFVVRIDGRPMVSRAHHDAMMGATATAGDDPEPDCNWREPWTDTGEPALTWLEREAHRYLVKPQEILDRIEPYTRGDGPALPGLYFIVQGDQIGYVGLSRSICERLQTHDQFSPFEVERFATIAPLPPLLLPSFEAFYIFLLEPPCNQKFEMPNPIAEKLVERARSGEFWSEVPDVSQ